MCPQSYHAHRGRAVEHVDVRWLARADHPELTLGPISDPPIEPTAAPAVLASTWNSQMPSSLVRRWVLRDGDARNARFVSIGSSGRIARNEPAVRTAPREFAGLNLNPVTLCAWR